MPTSVHSPQWDYGHQELDQNQLLFGPGTPLGRKKTTVGIAGSIYPSPGTIQRHEICTQCHRHQLKRHLPRELQERAVRLLREPCGHQQDGGQGACELPRRMPCCVCTLRQHRLRLEIGTMGRGRFRAAVHGPSLRR